MMATFRVLQIDHVEFFVPDRLEAAAWYQRVLGLEIVPEYRGWAANPGGPLMISSDDGNTKLALFEGRPQATTPTAGFHRVAFRVGARDFIEFLQRLADQPLNDHHGRPVTPDAVLDHQQAYSIYFSDPYGHRLEVTTYEYEATRAALVGVRGQHIRSAPKN
jgi:catechol 2,3-dioxygenase-like lactoylglutathione lyase family enzyme